MSTSEFSARTHDEYLETRVNHKTTTYRAKGVRYRWCYLTTAAAAAIAAATVPVLINLRVEPAIPTLVPTLVSLLVTILVTLEGIFHFREHWKNYDLMTSFLRQEACLFQAGAGVYRDKEPDEAFVLLVERVEDAISKERSQTIEMRTSRAPDEPTRPAGGRTEGIPVSRGTTPAPKPALANAPQI